MTGQQALPDPTAERVGWFHRGAGDTERQAAIRIAPHPGTQRKKVLDALAAVYPAGLTDYGMHTLFRIGCSRHVPGSRRKELQKDGWPIHDTGRRRPTNTGYPAIVWRLDDDQR